MNEENEKQLSNNELCVKLLQAIKTEAALTKQELKEEIKFENKKIFDALQEQRHRIETLENKYNKLELRYIHIEREYRKNNIVIFGLKVNAENDLLKCVVGKLNELLGLNISESEINNIYTIKSETESSPIKVEFVTYLRKSLVIKNGYKLKGSKIFIAHDLCLEDRNEQKILRQHLKFAKSKKQFAKIKGNKLFVNEDVYTVEQLQQMNIQVNVHDEAKSTKNFNKTSKLSISAPTTPTTPLPETSTSADLFNDVFEANYSSSDSVKAIHTTESPNNPPPKKKKPNNSVSSNAPSSPRVTRGNKPAAIKTIQLPSGI